MQSIQYNIFYLNFQPTGLLKHTVYDSLGFIIFETNVFSIETYSIWKFIGFVRYWAYSLRGPPSSNNSQLGKPSPHRILREAIFLDAAWYIFCNLLTFIS